ncbi:MAG: hydrogenase expression/formation C-terminal domain-containing protein [Planctomycetota bacterium]
MSNGGGYIDLSDRILGEGEPPLFGPGSQLDPDGIELKPMDMPRDMATFEPPMAPEPEDTVGMEAAKARLGEVQAALLAYRPGDPARVFDLRDLPPADLGLVNQLLGEGEVGVMLGKSLRIQESVFAGVWRVLHFDENEALCGDTIEVAAWPGAVRARTFAGAQTGLSGEPDAVPEGVVNAPSILIEVDEKARAFVSGGTSLINLQPAAAHGEGSALPG